MRLGLLSNSALQPNANWTTLAPPLFAAMNELASSRTIAPPPLALERLTEWRAVRAQVGACDLLFWLQGSSRAEPPIQVASMLKLRARRSAYVFDPWKSIVRKLGLLATIQRLDPCFVSYMEAAEDLRRLFPLGKFEWLPFGTDTGVFYPRKADKSIFAFWMGRRHEPLHQALLAYCEERKLTYVYSNAGNFSPSELGEITSKSLYFIVTPPSVQRSGGYSPLMMRYLEGLAAGTRLLGVLPNSGEYEALLPTDAICQVAADGSDLAARLAEDMDDGSRQRVVNSACALVHERHSWRKRAEQIFRRLSNGESVEFASPNAEPVRVSKNL